MVKRNMNATLYRSRHGVLAHSAPCAEDESLIQLAKLHPNKHYIASRAF